MQAGWRLCCTTIPNPAQKAFSRKLHFSVRLSYKSCRNFSITNITFDKIWMHICIYLSLLGGCGLGAIKMGELSIQELWEKCRSQYLCNAKALFRAKIDLCRVRVSELERRWKVPSWNANWKSFIFMFAFPFVWLAGSKRRFMLMLWIVGTIPKQKCSCMAIYSHKPFSVMAENDLRTSFTWKIDNLGKQKSTVVCRKCKQRSWWNNKINDTQPRSISLSLAWKDELETKPPPKILP